MGGGCCCWGERKYSDRERGKRDAENDRGEGHREDIGEIMESQSVMSLSSSGARRGALADEGDENEKSSNMVALSTLAISLQGDRSDNPPSVAAWDCVGTGSREVENWRGR